MSVAGIGWTEFRERVVAERIVFAFEDDEAWMAFPKGDSPIIPFWSTRSRAETVAKHHPDKFKGFRIIEIELAEFMSKTLPDFIEDGVLIGVNWAGKKMTGYDVPAEEVLKTLKVLVDKAS